MTISVIPRPDQLTATDHTFFLSHTTSLVVDPRCMHIARMLQSRLRAATGMDFEIAKFGDFFPNTIRLELDADLPPSAHRVSIDSSGVRLSGGDPAGLFHSTQTFLQLCPPNVFQRAPGPEVSWAVPGVEILDAPRFPWRGMLLDISRHFFGKNSILTVIDAIALHRFNVLHLHLTDDQGWRIEIRRYPRLTAIGSQRARSALGDTAELREGQSTVYDETPHDGYLSQDDIREIVTYAAERFITIVPEVDLPGHSQAAIAAYPELGNGGEAVSVWTDWGVNPRVLNIDDSTIEFYRNVFDEIFELFPGEYIHVGGDECPKDEWRESATAQARIKDLGLENEDELQSWLISTFADHFTQHGRRLIGWDEILEGGLPGQATVMSWRGVEGGIDAAEAGHDVIMTPESDTYLYRRQSDEPSSEPRGAEPVLSLRKVYDYDPMPKGLSESAQAHVLGSQCSMWTEFVGSERQMHQMMFPRLSAFAEAVWCRNRDPFESFIERLRPHMVRLHVLGIDGYALEQADANADNKAKGSESSNPL